MMKNLLRVLCALLVLALMLSAASGILQRKYSRKEYDVFFEQADQLDVLFLGPSVVHYSVYPMQLWHDYGITAYNMGNDSERLTMTYYTLLNALDYCQPRVAVIELTAMSWAGSRRDGTLVDHDFLDALPLSRNKLLEVNDLFTGKERLEYLFPFYLYHSRWNELDERDIFNHRYVQRGAEFLHAVVRAEKPEIGNAVPAENADTLFEMENLDRIIALCKERDITPVFVFFPNGSSEHVPLRLFCAEQLEKRNVRFLDLQDLEGLDWNRDFFDRNHLNYFGGTKLTDYLGQLLSQEYGIPDRRATLPSAEIWNADYAVYQDLVNAYLADNLSRYEAADGTVRAD